MVVTSGCLVVNGGGDNMFVGEFRHNLDDKGRLIIPQKLREKLENRLVITRGLDGCLFIYSEEEWRKISKKMEALPFESKNARTFERFFIAGAACLEFDKQGRVNISTSLIEYAELKKECVMLLLANRIELWSKEKFESFLKENEESLSDVTENLFKFETNA